MDAGSKMDPRELLTGAEWLIAGGTLMTALWLGTKRVYKLARNVDSTLTKIDTVGEQLSKLDLVMGQLVPNGGNSLYDKVHSIKETQAQNSAAISDINGRLKRLEGYHLRAAKTRSRKRNG